MYSDPDHFSIEKLWNDFESRSWIYSRLQHSSAIDRRLLNWIGSIDGCGHMREKCLRELIKSYQLGDENRILLRLEDWVPEVQAIARDWVMEHLESLKFNAIRANQRLLLFLSRKRILQGDPGIAEIERVLLEKVYPISETEFASLLPTFRRYLFRLSLRSDERLRWRLRGDKDPFNRLILLKHFSPEQLSPVEIDSLNRDKSIHVRRCLLKYLLDSGMTPSESELRELAVHRSCSLRELGTFYLKRLYGIDSYAIYRTFDDERFYYITDFSKLEDIGYFHRGLKSDRSKTRFICLRALATAAPDELRKIDIVALASQNRRNRDLLTQHLPRLFSIEEILSLKKAFTTDSVGGTVSYFHLVERKSYWHFVVLGLPYLQLGKSKRIRDYVIRRINVRCEHFGTLGSDLAEKISAQIRQIRENRGSELNGFLNRIELTMRSNYP